MVSGDRSLLLVVDMQARLVPVISGFEGILKKNEARLFACRNPDVPVVFTEQYPKGVRHTVPRLPGFASGASAYEKIHFNGIGEPEFVALLSRIGRRDVVVIRIEAHVSILQTSLGLRHLGYPVRLSVHSTGSRTELDKDTALKRTASAGTPAVTTEMVLVEWLRRLRGANLPCCCRAFANWSRQARCEACETTHGDVSRSSEFPTTA